MTIPTRKLKINIEDLGRELEFTEITVGYQMQCLEDPSFDTPINALKDTGMSEEDIKKLSVSTPRKLYEKIILFSFPQADENKPKDKDAKKNLEEPSPK